MVWFSFYVRWRVVTSPQQPRPLHRPLCDTAYETKDTMCDVSQASYHPSTLHHMRATTPLSHTAPHYTAARDTTLHMYCLVSSPVVRAVMPYATRMYLLYRECFMCVLCVPCCRYVSLMSLGATMGREQQCQSLRRRLVGGYGVMCWLCCVMVLSLRDRLILSLLWRGVSYHRGGGARQHQRETHSGDGKKQHPTVPHPTT